MLSGQKVIATVMTHGLMIPQTIGVNVLAENTERKPHTPFHGRVIVHNTGENAAHVQ